MLKIGIVGKRDAEIEDFINLAKDTHSSEITFIHFDGEDLEQQAKKAAQQAIGGTLQLLMKGLIPTKTLLKGLLQVEGIKEKERLTHVAIIELPRINRPIFLTDAGITIAPTIEEHLNIINQAIALAQATGITQPKVALLSAAEHYNPKMPSAVRAKALTKILSKREDALIYGPLSLDLALSKDSVRKKRFFGPIAGDADILVVPSIEVGNVLYKSLQLFGEATIGGLLTGAAVPIVLTSRSDSNQSRLLSLEYTLKQAKKER